MMAWLTGKFFRSYDLTGEGVALPMAIRKKDRDRWRKNKPLPPSRVVTRTCSECGVIYTERPIGAAVNEDGKCYACSTGAPRETPAKHPRPVPDDGDRLREDPSRRLRGRKGEWSP